MRKSVSAIATILKSLESQKTFEEIHSTVRKDHKLRFFLIKVILGTDEHWTRCRLEALCTHGFIREQKGEYVLTLLGFASIKACRELGS